MTAKDLIKAQTERATRELFRVARAVPADKLEWAPMELGRTVLNMLQECAQSPSWCISLLKTRQMPEFTPELMERMNEERRQWTSLEDAESACLKNLEAWRTTVDEFPEAGMHETMTLPFGEPRPWHMYELMLVHYWNCTYHLGQINYIQTLYGDREMH